MPRPIRAVLWDADGVLQELPGFDVLWHGLDDGVRDELLRAVFSDMPKVLRGHVDMAERVARVIEELGLQRHRDEIEAAWRACPLVEESTAILRRLRAAGVTCVLATNQDCWREEHMRPVFGPLLDKLYFSSAMGLAKPEPEFFTRIAADLGLEPAELLFIDDNRDNVAGAVSAGLVAQWWHHSEADESLADLVTRHGLALNG